MKPHEAEHDKFSWTKQLPEICKLNIFQRLYKAENYLNSHQPEWRKFCDYMIIQEKAQEGHNLEEGLN